MGPKAEHSETWQTTLRYVFTDYVHWRRNFFPEDPVVVPRHRRRYHAAWQDELSVQLDVLLNRLKADYPFYHPRYLGHMLSEQTLPSVLGWFAGVLYNANNVTDEAAPVTVELELEVGRMVAKMLGYTSDAWAHITSGGTIANIEALWVARTVQFTPFALQELCFSGAPDKYPLCEPKATDFEIGMPSGRSCALRAASHDELLRLSPTEAIGMPRALHEHLVRKGVDKLAASRIVKNALVQSKWNVAKRGFAAVSRRLEGGAQRPVVFAPASAHYSIDKACNILGYGEDALRRIPVDKNFRMDVAALEQAIATMEADEYIAAVIAVVGTTEEGAVDPVHEVMFLRSRLSQLAPGSDATAGLPEQSFWFHADAAWGGYVASLFRGLPIEKNSGPQDRLDQIARHDEDSDRSPQQSVGALAREYAKEIGASDEIRQQNKAPDGPKEHVSTIEWCDESVCSAFVTLPSADSITVDPHKLGYVPYPAGIVAFRNGLVTELIGQKANYIREGDDSAALAEKPEIKGVGAFILEGSKPGAAAASCWLAHKSIPLTSAGHGRIIRESVLAAKRLAFQLQHHRHEYSHHERRFRDRRQQRRADGSDKSSSWEHFTFTTIYEPDTNVVCFIVQPKDLHDDGKLTDTGYELVRLNEINAEVHKRLARPQDLGQGQRMPYGHPFFVSRTRLEDWQYQHATVEPLLGPMEISPADYKSGGLIVLRSTVMNPYYKTAQLETKKDYLRDFVDDLHCVAREVLDALPARNVASS